MLTRDLLRDAVRLAANTDTGKLRVTHMTIEGVQRRVRVGFATAMVITQALADAGVLGPHNAVRNRRQVLADDLDAAYALIDEAIDDGRIELTPTVNAPNPAVDHG